MAKGTMGDITPTEQGAGATASNLLQAFIPEVVTPISKRLTERGKNTPQADFYPISERIADQKLEHAKGDISAIIDTLQAQNIDVIGGGYDVGISGNSQTDKLIYALCQVVDRQERILNTPNSGIITLFGDETTKTAIRSTFADTTPIVINRVEFAKVYFGKKRIGGKEVAQVSQMLFELSTQRFLKVTEENGAKKISIVQPVIIPNLPIFESDGAAPFVVLLNTDFKRERKFIPFPIAYLKRTQKATHLQHQLYLLLAKRARSANLAHKETPCRVVITEANLWQIIATEPKYNRRPKKRQDDFIKAVQQCTELGLIISYEQGTTKAGEATAIFILNKSFHLQATETE